MNTYTGMWGQGEKKKPRCSKCGRTIFNEAALVCGVCARDEPKLKTLKLEGIRISRNEKCPCGSGKKFKNCHQPLAQQNGGYLLRNPEATETETP